MIVRLVKSAGFVDYWTYVVGQHTVVCMTTMDRITVSVPPEVGRAVREAARREHLSVSSYVTSVLEEKLRNVLLGSALDQWEAEHGAFTEEELAEARRWLGGSRRRAAK